MNRGDISDFYPGQGINGRTRPKINRRLKESSDLWRQFRINCSDGQVFHEERVPSDDLFTACNRAGGTRVFLVRSPKLRVVAQEALMNAPGPLSMFRPALWLAAAAFA